MTAPLYRVEDFLCNDDFIRYTLDCESDKHPYWSQYLNASDDIRKAFLQATDILLHLDSCTLLTPEEILELKRRIRRSLRLAVNN